ncbi:AcrR family transcriptional regulator [Streptomyces sp. SLBN-8D4]
MTKVDGRVERGNRTRRTVLRRAVDIASVEGLEALSVGRLAGELELSKSGVFALFGSKQELQLATVREASRIFVAEVLETASEAAEGLARLRDLCEGWLRYSERRVFPGGCFFYGVMAEFDAREGAVHDALVEAQRTWLAELERCAERAKGRGRAEREHRSGATRLRGRRVDGDGERDVGTARRDRALCQGPAGHRRTLADLRPEADWSPRPFRSRKLVARSFV